MASTEVFQAIREADEILETAQRPGIGTTLRHLRTCKALAPLREIESHCSKQEDIGPIKQRLLVIQCLAVESLYQDGLVRQDHAELLYRVEEILENWTWLYARPEHHDVECSTKFREVFSHVVTSGLGGPSTQELLYKFQKMFNAARRVCTDPFILALIAEVTNYILEECFHRAIRLYEDGKWAPSMSLLKSKDGELDVFVDIEQKLEHSSDEIFVSWGLGDGFGRAVDLRRDFSMQLAMCQGSQLLHLGDIHFKDALNGEPEDLLAGALLAQDDYRAALSLVAEQDVELEGAILTRLARFYAKITKIPTMAHQLYLRAVQLAAALQPALPKGAWYHECVTAVQAYRDALQAEEAKKWEHARKPILEKLTKEVEQLSGAKKKSDVEFVKFIFETWPPKTEGALEPPCDANDPSQISKKDFLKVIQRYHADKNMGWGDEWRVLSEEIAKELTARYNIMKGV